LTHGVQLTRMWANAKRDGHPAEYRWHPLFNAAKFGSRPLGLLECRAVARKKKKKERKKKDSRNHSMKIQWPALFHGAAIIKSKCIPALLYGLKACLLTKSDIRSVYFVINGFFNETFPNHRHK